MQIIKDFPDYSLQCEMVRKFYNDKVALEEENHIVVKDKVIIESETELTLEELYSFIKTELKEEHIFSIERYYNKKFYYISAY